MQDTSIKAYEKYLNERVSGQGTWDKKHRQEVFEVGYELWKFNLQDMPAKKTKKKYEKYLNDCKVPYDSKRMKHLYTRTSGRRTMHDAVAIQKLKDGLYGTEV